MLCRTDAGKGYTLNPYFEECWRINRNTRRRELFKKGIFKVTNDNGWIAFWVHGRFINGWSIHDMNHLNQAQDIITTTFHLYEALCDIRFDNMVKRVNE